MLTIGKVSKLFGVSRTALLYYDKIGLVCPTYRSESGYREYCETEIARLEQIMVLRKAGVPLSQMNDLLSAEESVVFGKLMKRLGELNVEIEELRKSQSAIIGILKESSLAKAVQNKDGQLLDSLLRHADIDAEQRASWHEEFEKQSPEQHEQLLSLLGLPHAET